MVKTGQATRTVAERWKRPLADPGNTRQGACSGPPLRPALLAHRPGFAIDQRPGNSAEA